MLEAKDTVIDSRINGLETDLQLLVDKMLIAQAEISFKAGYNEGYGKGRVDV